MNIFSLRILKNVWFKFRKDFSVRNEKCFNYVSLQIWKSARGEKSNLFFSQKAPMIVTGDQIEKKSDVIPSLPYGVCLSIQLTGKECLVYTKPRFLKWQRTSQTSPEMCCPWYIIIISSYTVLTAYVFWRRKLYRNSSISQWYFYYSFKQTRTSHRA